MGPCYPKYKDRGCISNAMKERDLVVAMYYPHTKKQTSRKDLVESIQKEISDRYKPRTPKQHHERRKIKYQYEMRKVLPEQIYDDGCLWALKEQSPLNIALLYQKEPKSQKFELLIILENQTNNANVRKCVWEDENKKVRLSELAPGIDFWRIADSSVPRNYPVGMACIDCHGQIRCKKDCQLWKQCGGYVEN